MRKIGIPDAKFQEAIDLLCESTFFGVEIDDERFEFMYDEDREEVFRSLARKTAERRGEERFLINTPFRSYLEIKQASN